MSGMENDSCQTDHDSSMTSPSTNTPIPSPQDRRTRRTRLSPPTSPPSLFSFTPDFPGSAQSSPAAHSPIRRRSPPSRSRSRSRSRDRTSKRRPPPPYPPSSPSTEPIFVKETRLVDAPVARVDLTVSSESEDEVEILSVHETQRNNGEEKEEAQSSSSTSQETRDRIFKEWSELLKGFVNEPEMGEILRTNIERGMLPSPTVSASKLFGAIKRGSSWMTEDLPQNGKTTTAMLSVLSRITLAYCEAHIEALVIHPHREGCIHARQTFQSLLNGTKYDVEHAFFVGQNTDSSLPANIRSLQSGQRVVFGCPGRISHLITAGYMQLDQIKTVVMEEWDILSHESFQTEMDVITNAVKQKNCLLLCFSSTTPEQNGVKENENWMRKVNECGKVGTDQRSGGEWQLDTIIPANVIVENDADRLSKLKEILQDNIQDRVLIFANTNMEVERIYESLQKWKSEEGSLLKLPKIDAFGSKIASIDAYSRQRRWDAIEQLTAIFLCSTQLAARNIKKFNVVINYEIPATVVEYKQRVGRLERNQRNRRLYNLDGKRDEEMMRHIHDLHRRHDPVKKESDISYDE